MTYKIAADETCVFCYAKNFSVVDEYIEDYRGGMRCVELKCNNCDAHFYVNCDEILPNGTLLHDKAEA